MFFHRPFHWRVMCLADRPKLPPHLLQEEPGGDFVTIFCGCMLLGLWQVLGVVKMRNKTEHRISMLIEIWQEKEMQTWIKWILPHIFYNVHTFVIFLNEMFIFENDNALAKISIFIIYILCTMFQKKCPNSTNRLWMNHFENLFHNIKYIFQNNNKLSNYIV